ncbi:C6 transcription factor [Pleurostoma richardsiae]|uniref:C6 transcription factor n=1 Tax=Pleurostoma richardsiae TaxID=41990 RepID=A0AA38S492_9PEZI|nr:C6 transcription factor [Pleurostoma richardsiae]
MSTPSNGTAGSPAVQRPRRGGAACRRCHSHKIKCSGGTPCRGCMRSNKASECVYPAKEKKVMVLESYIRQLEVEKEQLKRAAMQSPPTCSEPAVQMDELPGRQGSDEEDVAKAEVVNPVMEQRVCEPSTSTSRPVYVGAAACAAFADLLWHHVQPADEAPAPPRQVTVFNHPKLQRVIDAGYRLPSHTYATMLVQVVLKFVGNDYHLIKKKSFMQRIDQIYAALPEPPADPMFLCRMFVVFALGELYLRKSALTNDGQRAIPGTSFYLQAMSLFQELYEEPDIEYIETLLLMSFYSHALNRKNSAYTYAGIALRLSVAMGLHRNITYDPSTPPVEIENRRRVWWTVYTFDRLCSSKLGHPVMIKDEDIDAPFPSSEGLTFEEQEEFVDAAQLIANIRLARITGSLLDHTYKIHKPSENTFITDIHRILTSLKEWDATLAPELRLDHSRTPPYASRSVASLRLHFNQCVILTTRPVLLFVFKYYVRLSQLGAHSSGGSMKPPSPMTIALSEACIYAARASNRLLKQLWIDGAIATFGYFDAHYIFSSTIVLIVSNILNPNNTDKNSIDLALQLLQSMADDGNLPARELCERLASLKRELDTMCRDQNLGPDKGYITAAGTFAAHIVPSSRRSGGPETMRPSEATPVGSSPAGETSSTGPTLLEDPFLRDFLGQPYSEWSPSAFGMTNDEMGISSLAWDIETFSNI